MSQPAVPQVECYRQHPCLVVPDIPGTVAYYTTRLGFRLGFTWGEPPTFAGVLLGGQELFLQQGNASAGCSVFYVVGDADALFAWHQAGGVEVVEPPGDRNYGYRDYAIRDNNGYLLVFGHNIDPCEPVSEGEPGGA